MELSLVFHFLFAAYIYYRTIHPLKWRLPWNIFAGILLLLVAFKFLILYWLGGPLFFAPDLPACVIIGSSWLYAVFFLFFFLLFGANAVSRITELIICKIKKKSIHDAWHRNDNKINLIVLLFAVMLGTAGLAVGIGVPKVRVYDVNVKHLPVSADGITIAVLADLHVDGTMRKERLDRIIADTNSLNPDVIVLVGDLVDGKCQQRKENLRSLAGLHAKYGVFGVPGNHEYYSGYHEWMPFFQELKIRMLVNENIAIPLRDSVLYLAGTGDLASESRPGPPLDLKAALAGIPPSSPVILMSHRPKIAPESAKNGVSLQISGHTHGGMILGLNLLVGLVNGGFCSGMYDVNEMKLFVSNGTCIWNGFPIRIGIPSEIALLRLHRAD